MFCTYSCLVRETAGSSLCLVSSLCCSRWSRSDCEGNAPPRGGQGSALLGEGTGLPFSCMDLCPPWKSEGQTFVAFKLSSEAILINAVRYCHLALTRTYLTSLWRKHCWIFYFRGVQQFVLLYQPYY